MTLRPTLFSRFAVHAAFSASFAGAALLAACGPSPDPQNPSGVSSATPSAAPTVAPTAEPTASTTASAAANSPPPAPTSKFIAVSTLPAPTKLFAVDGRLMLALDEAAEIKPTGKWGIQLGFVDGDKAEFDTRYVLEGFHSVVEMRGSWPGTIQVLATGDTGRTGIAEQYVIDNKGLQAKSARVGNYYAGVAQVGGSLVALENPSMPFSPPKVVTISGAALSYKITPHDPKKCEYQKSAVVFSAFGGTGKGTLIGVGDSCSGAPSVETWTASGSPSTIADLSSFGIESNGAAIVTGPGDKAWIVSNKILEFDGSNWKVLPNPADKESVVEAASDSSGKLWALASSGSVYTFSSGTWQNETLPSGVKGVHIAVSKDGTVWVSTQSALLRTKRDKDGEGLRVEAKDSAPVKRKRAFTPGGPRCTSNVVVLYAFTKVTPDDYDFPLTRKALKGHGEFSKLKFVVTKDNGQKYFTAMGGDFASSEKLRAHIEKEVQGAKPTIVCTEPEVVREVKINLTTGDVIK
ncbi:MAG: hypothetical protein IPK82_35385 [Polyangiaceae bacterium]|nr:hypothetical protein [Polyangiaceae bacterium]